MTLDELKAAAERVLAELGTDKPETLRFVDERDQCLVAAFVRDLLCESPSLVAHATPYRGMIYLSTVMGFTSATARQLAADLLRAAEMIDRPARAAEKARRP